MSKKNKKWYVVWEGRTPGIFTDWNQCKVSIDGYPAAKYKSFLKQETAELAYHEGSKNYYGVKLEMPSLSERELKRIGTPIPESICVDGASSGSTGDSEYRGVYTLTKQELFHQGPYADGTNNIVEFLAIVHALAFCKEKKITIPIYSDSKIAIGWVKSKQARSKQEPTERNQPLFALLSRAENWLNTNSYPNKILKWETEAWGENLADFGRK
jgi:ribonuclease HI